VYAVSDPEYTCTADENEAFVASSRSYVAAPALAVQLTPYVPLDELAGTVTAAGAAGADSDTAHPFDPFLHRLDPAAFDARAR
jgi:hypothetical protein